MFRKHFSGQAALMALKALGRDFFTTIDRF
jgi:hypothetical protein